MKKYLVQEEVFKNKEIENTANSSEHKYGKGSKGNKHHIKIEGERLRVNPYGLENHSITIGLMSPYFTRK